MNKISRSDSEINSGITIKICGLSRACDIDYVNIAKPDFCGFVIGVPGSRRNVSLEQLLLLRPLLDSSIKPVGVFVNAPAKIIANLLNNGTISIAQLHGREDEGYIRTLRGNTDAPIVKAFSVSGAEDIALAEKCTADYVLFDNGAGGTGKSFDWGLLKAIRRPYFLAGGLTPENLSDAVSTAVAHAPSLFGLDVSSGVETCGYKDKDKIIAAVAAVRRWNR